MSRYQVLLEAVEPGKDPETALRDLAAMSKRSVDALRPLLASGRFVIKSGIDHETALRYQNAIRQIGWRCTVAPVATGEVSTPAAQPAADAAVEHAAAAQSAAPVSPAPRPLEPQSGSRSRWMIVGALSLAAVLALAGVAVHFYRTDIEFGVDVIGKWTCRRSDLPKTFPSDVLLFGSDGKFSMTNSTALDVQFTGVYTSRLDRLEVTIQDGSLMRRGNSKLGNIKLTGHARQRDRDTLALELADTLGEKTNWTCARL